jgi:hypothetical protein
MRKRIFFFLTQLLQLDLKPALCGCLFFCLFPLQLSAQDTWTIPLDGDLPTPLYRQAEEVFLNAWEVPPFEDLPVLSSALREDLAALSNQERAAPVLDSLREVDSALHLRFYPIAPVLELGASLAYQGNDEMYRMIPTQDYIKGSDPLNPNDIDVSGSWDKGRSFLDFMSLYEIQRYPAIMKLGVIGQFGPFALQILPFEVRAATSALLKDYNGTNFPSEFSRLDVNFPYRGLISFSFPYLDGQIGRDRLQVGPGEWSSLVLNRQIPY